MRTFLLFAAVLFCRTLSAQTVSTFETLPLVGADTYYVNYSSPNGNVGFNDGLAHFQCVFDTSFGGLWTSGFVYSNMTDSVTSGYLNQYAAKTASGYNGSSQYAVFWQGYGSINKIVLTGAAAGKPVAGVYITNSTYAYNSMRDGYFSAKKFGGASGDDPDWFKLAVYGYSGGVQKTDSVEFYLADYRSANNANDYIIKNWTWVNLLPLGNVDSISFNLTSSDTGAFGMNTPAYFCMDDFTTGETASVSEAKTADVKIFPNPVQDKLFLSSGSGQALGVVRLYDLSGKQLRYHAFDTLNAAIDMVSLPAGTYILQLTGNKGTSSLRIQKL